MSGSYTKLVTSKKIDKHIEQLYSILSACELCPRKCQVNRLKGEKGFCKSAEEVIISSVGPHFGEEPELVGRKGSGTIFLTNCNLGCVYCQNYDISHLGHGRIMSLEEIAKCMISLQNIGCHNINFVTPTHFTPQLVKAIKIAAQMGLKVPIVYNCGGYENVEVIKLLEGIIDIYMPDIKYSDSVEAKKYSTAADYFDRCCEAIKEMHRQVGDLEVKNGIATRGLLVRHLILPNNIAGTEKVLRFIAEKVSRHTYVNIMDQYRPLYRANEFPEINRRPTVNEYNAAVEIAEKLGLYRGFSKEGKLLRLIMLH